MKALQGGCVLYLALWAAASAGYYSLLSKHVGERGPAIAISLFVGLFGVLFLGALWTLARGTEDVAALKREEKGEKKVDGRLEAASGQIYPTREPLVSPLDGRECVAYEYEIGPPKTDEEGSARNFFGVALTPSSIRSPFGSIALLGWAMLDEMPRHKVSSDERRQRAEQWVANTRFETMSLKKVFSMLGELMADDDGAVRNDWCTEPRPTSLDGLVFKERVVEVGKTVTALGYFSAAKGGLVPKSGDKQTVCRLIPGDVTTARARLGRKAMTGLVVTGICFAGLNGIVWLLLHRT